MYHAAVDDLAVFWQVVSTLGALISAGIWSAALRAKKMGRWLQIVCSGRIHLYNKKGGLFSRQRLCGTKCVEALPVVLLSASFQQKAHDLLSRHHAESSERLYIETTIQRAPPRKLRKLEIAKKKAFGEYPTE